MTEKQKIPSESCEQIQFVSWFRKTFPGVLIFSIPNGGSRHMATAVRMKAEGTVRGVPDLYIPACDLWIEMKRQKGGRLSQEQKKMIEYLENECNHSIIIGYGFEDAKEKVLEWTGYSQLS